MKEINVVNVVEGMKDKLNYNFDVNERVNSMNQFFECGSNEVNDLLDYFETPAYLKKHGRKTKKDPRSDEDYFCNQLSDIATYFLEMYDDKENPTCTEYEPISKYRLEKDANDRKNKRIIGFNSDVVDDTLANGVPNSVVLGFEMHVDALEKFTTKEHEMFKDAFKQTEKSKREKVREGILKDLDKYPVLKDRYLHWREFGRLYGFSDVYTKTQKDSVKQYWLEQFAKEQHYYKPGARYYNLRKIHNQIGYELTLLREHLRQPIHRTNHKEPSPNHLVEEIVEKTFSFKDTSHIASMLSIQKESKQVRVYGRKEWRVTYYPLFAMLDKKHRDNLGSPINHIINELYKTIEIADLEDVERDIIQILIEDENILQEVKLLEAFNPYQAIANYINNKYSLNKSKRDIKRIINNKISKVIAKTYKDLEAGKGFKVCSCCQKEKIASTNNFGVTRHVKSGLKSICKKCTNKKAQKFKKTS